MNRLNLLVLFGGMAEEHNVSIKSAKQLAGWLNPQKYNTYFVYITPNGEWRMVATPDGSLSDGKQVTLCANRIFRGLIGLEQNERIAIDVVFPMLHGNYGEDGTMQGLLELSGIDYVGCDLTASAICMDKSLTYLVAKQAGVPVPQFTILEDENVSIGNLSYPVFVKPARSGSSFGVTKVSCQSELEAAVNEARKYDSKVLVEEAVIGHEVGCAVLSSEEGVITGEIDQIELTGGFFRVHQEKQPEKGSENSVIHVPAKISYDLRCKVAETAKKLYRAIGCQGLARVDMFLLSDGTVMLNEINTMPGFTSYSRYPRMMKASGFSMNTVVDQLIIEARGGKE